MVMTALDYEGIRQLLARYSVVIDFGDTTAFQACFTPDGVFAEAGLPSGTPLEGRFEGRESIGEFAAGFFASTQGHVRHWPSLPLIEGDGRNATGVTFLMVLRPGASPDTGVILTGVYRDRYIKIDDQWYFAAREFTADPQPSIAVPLRRIRWSAVSMTSSPAGRAPPRATPWPTHSVRLWTLTNWS